MILARYWCDTHAIPRGFVRKRRTAVRREPARRSVLELGVRWRWRWLSSSDPRVSQHRNHHHHSITQLRQSYRSQRHHHEGVEGASAATLAAPAPAPAASPPLSPPPHSLRALAIPIPGHRSARSVVVVMHLFSFLTSVREHPY